MGGSDELHSLAFSSMTTNSASLGGSVAWDFHSLGVLNADMSQFLYMDRTPPFEDIDREYYSSSSIEGEEADYSSTGYLEDVLFGFSSSKRRRLLYCSDNSTENCWTPNLFSSYCRHDSDGLSKFRMTKSTDRIISEMKTPDQETFSDTHDSSSVTSHKLSTDTHWKSLQDKATTLHCIDPIFSSGPKEKRKKRVLAKVVYPFAVVKPGGFEGDVTLNDINERILMPPTRPVRHPVGDFACRPLVSPDGPGLFGKAVIAFTRIHTQGRGTITIIRTRG